MKVHSVCAVVFFLVVAPVRSNVLVPGFTEGTIPIPGVSGITDIEWAPDTSRRLFIALKDGTVRILKDNQLLPESFAVVQPVYTDSECGLVGLCFDPNFLQNRFVYFFVTVSGNEQQIIRYRDADDVGV